MADMYGSDILSGTARRRRPEVPVVDAERDLVVEDAESGFCGAVVGFDRSYDCLLYTSPSPRDATLSRMPSSA